MDYIKEYKKNSRMIYVMGIIFIFAAMGMWLGAIPSVVGVPTIFLGLVLYGAGVRSSFAAMMNGGEDRFIELLSISDRNELQQAEFKALQGLYGFIKPISSRMPDEVADYRMEKIFAVEKIMKEKENTEAA